MRVAKFSGIVYIYGLTSNLRASIVVWFYFVCFVEVLLLLLLFCFVFVFLFFVLFFFFVVVFGFWLVFFWRGGRFVCFCSFCLIISYLEKLLKWKTNIDHFYVQLPRFLKHPLTKRREDYCEFYVHPTVASLQQLTDMLWERNNLSRCALLISELP